METESRRIGLLGCGHRGLLGFLGSLKEIGKGDHVAALCDINSTRLEVARDFLGHPGCRCVTDVDEFLKGGDFDTVIIATPDHTHADLAEACFAAGKAVVCEKPMATTLDDCRRIITARGDLECRVAFNFRYNPVAKETKELVASGAIGNVLSVEAHDIVGWPHGADYFRRWHRFQEKSGGLLIHKSTHTFDVINWWLDDVPETVYATGARAFYTADKQKGERCSACPAAGECPFYVDLRENFEGQDAPFEQFYRKMYLDAEQHDGYMRDACVFDRNSDIMDTYNVNATYQGGALLNYSAIFYAPYEDRIFTLQGDQGRIEVSRNRREIRVTYGPESKDEEVRVIPPQSGGHGGADVRLARALFGEVPGDIANATAEAAYWSVALADSANRSMQTGAPVTVPGIDAPMENA
jgi:predicted dehydrogenase